VMKGDPLQHRICPRLSDKQEEHRCHVVESLRREQPWHEAIFLFLFLLFLLLLLLLLLLLQEAWWVRVGCIPDSSIRKGGQRARC